MRSKTKSTATDEPMRAFSYIRWSSEHQSKGDSLRRQLTLAETYAHRHNLLLDTSTYQDHGISAFTGANLVEGKLGAFLKAIDDGHIQTPCFLLVEALDRITRTEIDVALDSFLSIIRRGVTIVTLQTEQVFSKDTIKKDRGISLIIAISMLVQGHEDSAKRALRIRAAYDAKRERGEKKITKVPSWLIPNPDRKTFKKDPVKVKLINRIFDMAIEGRGQRDIATVLNQEKVPTLQWAKLWDQGAVGSVLSNHAVYGRKHRTNQDDFWPPIMSKEKFMTAQDGIRGRTWKGANRQGIPNIFTGLAYCAVCGSRMRLLPTGNGYYYMRCVQMELKACRTRPIPYQACEAGFVHTMSTKAGLDISGEFFVSEAKQVPALRGEIEALKKRQRQLLKLADLAAGVEVVGEELKVLQGKIDAMDHQMQQINQAPLSRAEVARHRDLFARYLKLTEKKLRESGWRNDVAATDEGGMDLRRKMKVAMARLFKRIEFGMDRNGVNPTLYVTLIDDSRAIVHVAEFLTPNSRARQLDKNVRMLMKHKQNRKRA